MPTRRFKVESADVAAHERALARELGLESEDPVRLDLDVMDTFDGRLVRGGGIVLHQSRADGRAELRWTSLGLDEDRGLIHVDPGTRTFDRDALPPGPVSARLAEVLDVRALLSFAHVEGPVRRWVRRDRRGKVVLRVRIEPATTVRSPRGRRVFDLPAQIHVVGLKGFESRFRAAVAAIAGRRTVTEAPQPWAIDVLEAVGHPPGRDPSTVPIDLEPDMTPREALRAICGAHLRVIRANRDGTRTALDPEFLHDFRVAIRRTRTLLKASRETWPGVLWERFRNEFRWLARQTSEARDLDVYVLEFEDLRNRLPVTDRPALDPVRDRLVAARARAHAAVAGTLAGERTSSLLNDWNALLRSRAFVDDVASGRTAAGLAAELVTRAHGRVLDDGRLIDDDSPDQDLHDLRKRTKELRYLVDGFADLFPRGAAKRQIRALKTLQDNLGVHQDRVVQATTLRRLALQLDPAPAPTLVALGYLIEQLDRDARRLRDEFAARFADYDAKKRRADFTTMVDRARARAREVAG